MTAYTRERGGVLLNSPATGEIRTPKAATLPLRTRMTRVAGTGRGQLADWDAEIAIEKAFYMNVFVYRCVQLRAQLLSGLPIRVGADPENPSDYDKNKTSALAKFLFGNRELPWRTIMGLASAQYDLTGRYAWEIDADAAGVPVAPYPLLVQFLHPVPSERGPNYFTGYEYIPTGTFQYRIKRLSLKQCHYAWRPSQRDLRQPESPLESAGINVNVLVALDTYSAAFMRNDARPAALIVHEAFATEEETRNFRAQWMAEHRGPNNSGKPAFIEFEPGEDTVGATGNIDGVVGVKNLGLSQRDAQMVQTLREEIRAVCIAFGVPISALGDASERTYDNAGVEGRNLWELTMLPYKREHEDHINTKIAPLFGSNVMWFDTSKVKALKDRKFNGILTPDVLFKSVTVNEVRSDLDLPPLDDGGMLLGLSATPIAPETVVEDEDAPRPISADSDPNDPERGVLHAELIRPDQRSLPSPIPLLKHTDDRHKGDHGPHVKAPFDYEAARAKALARHTRETLAQRKLWAKAFRNLLSKQEAHVLGRMEGKRGRQRLEKRDDQTDGVDLAAFYEANHRATESRDVAAHLVEHTAYCGGSRLVDDFGVEFDVEAEESQGFVNEIAIRLGEQVVTYVSDALTATLTDGLNADEQLGQLNQRVTDTFTLAKDELVSTLTGEVPGVLNYAAFRVAPPTALIEWVASDDHDHLDVDQLTTVGGKPFRVGATEVFPDACGCTLIAWTEELAATRGKRIVELRTALAVLDMVEAKIISARQVRRTIRALEAA